MGFRVWLGFLLLFMLRIDSIHAMNYRSRWCEPILESALKTMPVVVVTGARQTGKTTLVRHGKKLRKRRFFTLDQIDVLEQAERDPDSLLVDLPVTIDEIQRAPGLLLAIKRRVDENRVAGSILATGSANLTLFDKVGESLAGRAFYLELPPFCSSEWSGVDAVRRGLDALFSATFEIDAWPTGGCDWKAWCTRGGYPSVLGTDGGESGDFWFAGYVQTYLERDLRQLSHVSNLANFQRLMRTAALRVSRLVNQSDLSRETGVPQPTVHRHLNLLETGYQIARMTNYHRNPRKTLIKGRKLQWTDAGLAAWLASVDARDLKRQAEAGFWLEQTVYQTLQSWKSLGSRRNVHFWREGSREVDFVIEQAGQIVGIEVKAGRQVSSSDVRGIRAFQQTFAEGAQVPRCVVLHTGTEGRFLGDNAYALPLAGFAPEI